MASETPNPETHNHIASQNASLTYHLPWQAEVWANFTDRLRKDRLPHAILLCGEYGTGTELLSRAMAHYAACLSPTETVTCGTCRACALLSSDSYPDFISIAVEDKAKQIKVEQIRLINSFVSKTPQFSGRKVILIERAELMNINAANALLKNLEEPAGDTLFVLSTHQNSRVLPTIRSRCLQLTSPFPNRNEALSWLQFHRVDDAESMLAYAKGAPLRALEWFTNGLLSEKTEVFKDLYQILMGQQSSLQVAQRWLGMDHEAVLSSLQFVVDECVKSKLSSHQSPSILQKLVRQVSTFDVRLIFRLRDKLLQKRAELLSTSNLNPNLFIEELALDWAALCDHGSKTRS